MPASGVFHLDSDKFSLVTADNELDLVAVPDAKSCSGEGSFLEGKNVVLCPVLCAIAPKETKPALLVTPSTCSL